MVSAPEWCRLHGLSLARSYPRSVNVEALPLVSILTWINVEGSKIAQASARMQIKEAGVITKSETIIAIFGVATAATLPTFTAFFL